MVTGSTSASTGVAPAWMMALTVAQNVRAASITSSPGSSRAQQASAAPPSGVHRDRVPGALVPAKPARRRPPWDRSPATRPEAGDDLCNLGLLDRGRPKTR